MVDGVKQGQGSLLSKDEGSDAEIRLGVGSLSDVLRSPGKLTDGRDGQHWMGETSSSRLRPRVGCGRVGFVIRGKEARPGSQKKPRA